MFETLPSSSFISTRPKFGQLNKKCRIRSNVVHHDYPETVLRLRVDTDLLCIRLFAASYFLSHEPEGEGDDLEASIFKG